jgi:release factor glutamine methyltransferase
MLTVLEIIKRTTEFFANKGIENPRLNAELLVGHGLGLKRMELYIQFERPLTNEELEHIRPLVRRRGAREPLQYIVGEMEFAGVRLRVDRRALIPRPETELLVENVLSRISADFRRILDLGTGTGALALALAKALPEAKAVAVDRSEEALSLARENSVLNQLEERVECRNSDWFSRVPADEVFDVIVSNPPYLSPQETNETAPEVREFEPVAALTGEGWDGAGDLRKIIAGAPSHLRAGGLIALETGIAQHAALSESLVAAGFSNIESVPDLTGRDRFLIARL